MVRSADAGSDHYLVVAVIKIKLFALKKPRSSRKKYCTYRFKDQTVREEFAIALTNKYDALYNEPVDEEATELDIEQEWSKIKEMYSSTCEEVLGKAKKERKAWRVRTPGDLSRRDACRKQSWRLPRRDRRSWPR